MVDHDPENPFVVAKDTVTGATHVLARSALIAADEGRYEVTDRSPFDHNGDLLSSKPSVPIKDAKSNREPKKVAAPSQPSTTTEEK